MSENEHDMMAIAGALPLNILQTEIDRRGLCVWTTEARDAAEAIFKHMQGRDPAKLDALVEAVRRVRDVFIAINPDTANTDPDRIIHDMVSAHINLRDAFAAFEGGEK